MIKKRTQFLKRSLSLLLTILMLIPTVAYADWNPNASGGGSTQVSGGTYDTWYSGYRVTLFDGDQLMYPSGGCKDILFSTPPTGGNLYFDNKLKNAQATQKGGTIGPAGTNADLKEMPLPILWDSSTSKFLGNGKAVRRYLMEGITESGQIASGNMGENPFGGPPTSGVSYAEGQTQSNLTGEEVAVVNQIVKIYNEQMSKYATKQLNRISSAIAYVKKNGTSGGYNLVSTSEFKSNMGQYISRARSDLDHSSSLTAEQRARALELIDLNYQQICKIYDSQHFEYTRLLKESTTSAGAGPRSRSVPSTAGEEATNTSGGSKMSIFVQACFGDEHPDVLKDIENAKDPRILIEAVVWYRPVSLSGVASSTYVYGTAANIAEFNIANAGVLGNDKGALMQLLTNNALPVCLVADKDDMMLKITKGDETRSFVPSQEIIG